MIQLPLPLQPLLPGVAKNGLALLGIHTLYFPCIYLGGADAPAPLWGLTYGICSDMMRRCGLPTFDERRKLALNRDVLPFRSRSVIGDLLIRSYYSRFPRAVGVGLLLAASLPVLLSRL